MSVILAIDPGTVQSAWVAYDPDARRVVDFGIYPNDDVRELLHGRAWIVVIEKVESYGMPVGAEVFETVRWAGRFEEAAQPCSVRRLPRRDAKLHLCGDSRAKDANIRQALLDKFGGRSATGTKKSPGPLYGIHADLWAALAVAVTYAETRP